MTRFRPLLHGRGAAGATALQGAALLPPLAVVMVERGTGALVLLIASLVVVLFWENLFCRLRHRRQSLNSVTTAVIFAILAPADAALWQIAVVLSMGVVIGEMIFGGRGFGFLSAAAVALALLLFSFPGTVLPAPGVAVALASLPGAALLLAAGLIAWRLPVACLVTLVALDGLLFSPAEALALAGALVFALVFLISDPAAAAGTNDGRVAHGALAGALIWIFDGATGPALDPAAVVFAALLASLFAPLFDYLAILLNARRRRMRRV